MKNTYSSKHNITAEVDEAMPQGMIIVQRPNNQSVSFFDPLIDIIDLSYTLRDKLFFIAHYVRKNKIVFEDCLSSGDKQIIEKVLNDSATKTKSFWTNLLNNNKISYHDNLYTHITKDLKTLEKHDRLTYKYFYKWFNLEQYGKEKINAILNNQIYIPSPLEFNDRFDAQLHLSNDDILEIAEANKQNEPYVKLIELSLNHMPRVCSFSLNNPIDLEANIMWGLYGNCSSGFAVSYKILDIVGLLIRSHFNVKNEPYAITMSTRDNIDVMNFKKVVYCELSTFDTFKTLVHKYFKNKSTVELGEFLTSDFLIKKSVCWKHEKELRLFKLVGIPQQLNDTLLKPVNNSTNEEIESIYKDVMDRELKSESRYEQFIAPNKIILGWNCNLENQNIIRLLDYAKSNTIKVIKLNGKIHHQRKEFESII